MGRWGSDTLVQHPHAMVMRPMEECGEAECHHRGSCMRDRTGPGANKPPQCKCFSEWGGEHCETPKKSYCINHCSGHGDCFRGFCHCEQGYEPFLGDATSSLGDAMSSLGDAQSFLGDAQSSLGDARSSLGDAKELAGWR